MIVFFHFIFSFTKYLWETYVHRQVSQDLKVLFETNSKTEAFEKYENRRLNLESLGISNNAHEHNLKWTTDEGDFFRSSDFQINFEPAYYAEDNIRFKPPVFQQRYLTVQHIISNPKWGEKIRKVVEFGCAELALLNYLKLIQGITEINLVDIDGNLLRDNVYRIQPWFCESYNFQRKVPLTVNVLKGSVSHPDRHCKGVDAVIAIELIEHMYEDELSQLPQNIFGYIKPRVAIFTTPNSEFNVLFINFSGFRHHDHKFEWTRKEFESWANNICVQYPEYEVHFIGIGPPPIGKEDLGYCTQGAVFMRVQNDADNQTDCEELNTDSYELIETAEYPAVEELAPEIKTVIDAGHYIRVCERLGEFQKDYKTVIPLSSILIRVYKNCKSIEKLRQILEEKYKIEENSDGEEVLVYSGESEPESDSGLDENYLNNAVQDNSDDTKCNNQWEQGSQSSWGSVKDSKDNNIDENPWGDENCDLTWNCEEIDQSKVSETATKDNLDNHQWEEESSNCVEIEQKEISRVNSSSDVSCDNFDNLKEILTNLPSLLPYCESDFIFDPSQQSDISLILEDARSVGLETIVSVSDENYESSNVDSYSQIRTSDSSFVMDDNQSFNGPAYLTEGPDCGIDLTKSKSLQSVGEKYVFGKSCHDVKGTKSLESITKKHENLFENCGDDLKIWKSPNCVSEIQKNVTGKCHLEKSRTLDCIENELKTSKNIPNSLEEHKDFGERYGEGGTKLDESKLSGEYSSEHADVSDGCENVDLGKNSFDLPNISEKFQNSEIYFEEQLKNTDNTQSITQPTGKFQDETKHPDPISKNLDSQEFCFREEKLSSDHLGEQQLSDFDSTSSLNPRLSNETVILQDSELVTEEDISGNNSKLPKSVQDSSSCELIENISQIEFEDESARPSKSKDSDLSYKSCDTSIREEDNVLRGDCAGNACLPDLEGLNLSSKQSSDSMDESRRFSSTSFIYKSQSQEKIKEIFSFRSIGSVKFESDAKKSKMGVSEGKDCESSPLHKCYSTGKISKDFSAYNEGVISNSCVDKFPSSLSSELEFFDKNNDLARERRCMSVSCIGNINVDYDENSCVEERELQNSCSPDKFGPDSGYPNSSSGLDMEMDTPEQVKEIITESESSFDESPLESPDVEELPFENNAVAHAPVIPVGENVENGDVANNNRDGEGNNMVGPGVVGDVLEFHALIEENEGNLQLMGAACNVEEESKNVDESKTTKVNEVESVVERTCDSSSSPAIPETNNNSGEKLSSSDGRSQHDFMSGNNGRVQESPTSNPDQSKKSQLDFATTSSSFVNTTDQGSCSIHTEQKPQSQLDLLSSTSSSATNNSADQGYSSSHLEQNLRSQHDLQSNSSSTVNNSADQGYSSSHSEQNLRSQLDPPSTTSSATINFSNPGSSNFHPEQCLWSPIDLPSTSSSTMPARNNTSDGCLQHFEELDIEEVNDLNALVPLSLVEIVLNRLIREMAEDVLLQMEIDNALDLLAAEDAVQILDADAVIEQDPTDFMAGGDSAAENM